MLPYIIKFFGKTYPIHYPQKIPNSPISDSVSVFFQTLVMYLYKKYNAIYSTECYPIVHFLEFDTWTINNTLPGWVDN